MFITYSLQLEPVRLPEESECSEQPDNTEQFEYEYKLGHVESAGYLFGEANAEAAKSNHVR
jgi:hypothetical protein